MVRLIAPNGAAVHTDEETAEKLIGLGYRPAGDIADPDDEPTTKAPEPKPSTRRRRSGPFETE